MKHLKLKKAYLVLQTSIFFERKKISKARGPKRKRFDIK